MDKRTVYAHELAPDHGVMVICAGPLDAEALDALQGFIDRHQAVLAKRTAQETAVVLGVDLAKPGSDSTVFWCPNCRQQLPSVDVVHDCPALNRRAE